MRAKTRKLHKEDRRKIEKIRYPFKTKYYAAISDNEDAWVTQGSTKTEDGGIGATVVRIALKQHGKAIVFDRRTGAVVYTVVRTENGIQTYYGRAVPAIYNIRRVK